MPLQDLPPNDLEIKIASRAGVIPACPFCESAAFMSSSLNVEAFGGPLYQARISCTNISCNARVLINQRTLEHAQSDVMKNWARAPRAQAQQKGPA